jgi:hypothetical protein
VGGRRFVAHRAGCVWRQRCRTRRRGHRSVCGSMRLTYPRTSQANNCRVRLPIVRPDDQPRWPDDLPRLAREQFVCGRDDAVSRLHHTSVVSLDETGALSKAATPTTGCPVRPGRRPHSSASSRCGPGVNYDGQSWPRRWCSDRHAAQYGDADAHQACHAISRAMSPVCSTAEEDILLMRLKLWLNKACGLAEDIARLAPSTIAARQPALK